MAVKSCGENLVWDEPQPRRSEVPGRDDHNILYIEQPTNGKTKTRMRDVFGQRLNMNTMLHTIQVMKMVRS